MKRDDFEPEDTNHANEMAVVERKLRGRRAGMRRDARTLGFSRCDAKRLHV